MAAALPQASTVALQGLRNKGQLQEGQKVLINGGGGSTGTFAIQLAKYFGAHVTAIDKTHKLDLMRSLGADQVIDYTLEDFAKQAECYDLVLDVVGLRSIWDFKRVLKNKGRYVMLGGPVKRILQALFFGPWITLFTGKKMGILAHKQNEEDIYYISKLISEGHIRPVMDELFTLEQAPKAMKHLADGKALGKVVLND